jgi:3-oxoacyl-[acyl-carrier protein] reductase
LSTAGERLRGKKAVVTGGSSGIGRAIALAFAQEGADVLVSYRRNAKGAEEVLAAARALGQKALAVQADLGKSADVDRLVAEAFGHLERVDIWVNNAGADILTSEGRQRSDVEKLEATLDVDLRGTVLCSWQVALRLKAQGAGVILNMSWDHVLTGAAGRPRSSQRPRAVSWPSASR